MSTYTYKNFKLVLTASYVSAYTCPASTTSIVTHCQAANIDGVNTVVLDGQWLDDSDTDAAIRLVSALSIPIGSSIAPIDGQLVLETGDQLQFKAAATGDIEVSGSVVEITA